MRLKIILLFTNIILVSYHVCLFVYLWRLFHNNNSCQACGWCGCNFWNVHILSDWLWPDSSVFLSICDSMPKCIVWLRMNYSKNALLLFFCLFVSIKKNSQKFYIIFNRKQNYYFNCYILVIYLAVNLWGDLFPVTFSFFY